MKKSEELKKYCSMKTPELKAELNNIKQEYVLYSLKVKAGKVTDFSKINKLRKNIAQIKTVLNGNLSGDKNE